MRPGNSNREWSFFQGSLFEPFITELKLNFSNFRSDLFFTSKPPHTGFGHSNTENGRWNIESSKRVLFLFHHNYYYIKFYIKIQKFERKNLYCKFQF